MGRKKKNQDAEIKEDKIWEVCEEGNEIIKKLCAKYPELLWAVDPKAVQVYGVTNKDKPESSNVLAKIRPINGVMAAILEANHIGIKFIIEMFFSDWTSFDMSQKSWVILHELLHIQDPDTTKTRKHNIEDFSLILSVKGVLGGYEKGLPDLFGDKPVEFDKALVAQLHAEEKDDEDADPTPTPPENL